MNSIRISLFLLVCFSLFACQTDTSSPSQGEDFDPSAPKSGEVKHISTTPSQDSLVPLPPPPSQLAGKPIAFYVDHPDVQADVLSFFHGTWRATKDDRTVSLLKLITDSTEVLLPFHFYLMDRIVQETDGSLSELISMRLLDFVQSHPQVFAQHFIETDVQPAALIPHASLIGYELVLQERPLEAYQAFQDQLMTRCQSCKAEQKLVLTDFLSTVLQVIRMQSEELDEE